MSDTSSHLAAPLPGGAPPGSAPPGGERESGAAARGRGARGGSYWLARLIALRIGTGLIVLWAAATITFFALMALPGQTQDVLAGDQSYPGLAQAIAQQWGLNSPPIVQYFRYLGRLLQGNLGTSYVQREPVWLLLKANVWPTVQLALSAAVLAIVLALLAATATAGRRRGLRAVLSATEVTITSLPVYWLAILLLLAFSFRLHVFPIVGTNGLRALVLPAVSLALAPAAVLSQVLRQALENTLQATFIVTVRARGLSETAVLYRHALKHAMLPAMSLSGPLLGSLLGGTVITEQIFGRPGLGSVALTAVTNKDVPVVLAVVILIALIYVVLSTLIDIAYLLTDTRLRTDHAA